MSSAKIITVDGPSASGKSSVSRLVAKNLGWNWVSTGAFYRGLALAAIKEGVDPQDEQKILSLVTSDVWSVKMTTGDTEVFYKGDNVTSEIAGEEVGALASLISQRPEVREGLLELQRNCYDPAQGLVAEGRDCGTVVFPQAPAKIYLTASPALRAMRRSKEEGVDVSVTQEKQIQRDAQDSGRQVAPMKEADGALKIDSSFLSLEEVVNEVLNYAKKKL
jgi:cytidylate kinase